jgi:hypothetical protein
MAYMNIADYSLKVRRELLWDKWAGVTPTGTDQAAAAEQIPVPAELIEAIEAQNGGTIVEWTVDTSEADDALQGCGCW